MGKRSEIDAYRLQARGGKGVINLKTSEKTGKVVAIKSVVPEDQLMVITRNGVINRQRIDEIRVIGRATQGVRLVNLDENDSVMDVARVFPDPPNGESNSEGASGDGAGAAGEEAAGGGAEGEQDAKASVDLSTGDAVEPDSPTEGE